MNVAGFFTNIVRYFLILWMFISPVSCIDEIELKIDDVEEKIVIEGLIADSLDLYTITVKQTRDKGLYPVQNAKVEVIEEGGKAIAFIESKVYEGNYQARMKAENTKAYFIRVTNGSKVYESIPSRPIASPKITKPTHFVSERVYIDGSGAQATEIDVNMVVDINFDASRPKPYLRWRAKGEYEFHEFTLPGSKWCYVYENNDFNKLLLYDPKLLPSNTLTSQEINFTELDFRFYNLYCFHVYQYTMSKEEYEYWQSLKTLIENKGTLYDPPVGNVKGNLFSKDDAEEQVVGYFSVAGVSYVRHFVDPATLTPYFPRDPCMRFFNPPRTCNDCLILKGSTATKPSYWP